MTTTAEQVARFGGLSLVKKDGSRSQTFPLVEKRYLFGRADYCDIRINLLNVSREHAEIVVDDQGQVWVRTLSKTADTRVAEKQVKEALLKDGDTIGIGDRYFIYHAMDSPASAKKVWLVDRCEIQCCSRRRVGPRGCWCRAGPVQNSAPLPTLP
jgi:pSer/pThr/pTyr-binding forkhead associated (FHA) protein